jgi:alkylation response protein AidB-like acyl-CoA dehydrogenase
VPAERVTRILPVGPSADPLVFGIFAAFELLIACVYTGLARRALDLAIGAVQTSSSKAAGVPRWQDSDVRRRVADAAIALEALEPQILGAARDVDELVDRGADWFPTLVGTKIRATETARAVVDQAVRIVGGAAYANTAELSRLSRDVTAGLFHPSNLASAQRTFASRYLGPLPS